MGKNILVIGGTRFFGRLLVRRLVEAGNTVTIATRGQAADPFGDSVGRIRVDRRDARAMAHAFAGAAYDVVFDQMCYTPLDAAISCDVFAGKVQRYVMSSTIESYSHLRGGAVRLLREDDLDLAAQRVQMQYPWQAPELADDSYGLGKRQAEAYLYRDGRLPVVSVRIAHVLAGPDDFTGRLASYVGLVARGAPLRHSAAPGISSFTNPQAISDFLAWTGGQAFLGPVNSACDGALTALDIYRRVAALAGKPALTITAERPSVPSELSPFDYPAPYAMDTARAKALGYRFAHSADWLAGAIAEHLDARSA